MLTLPRWAAGTLIAIAVIAVLLAPKFLDLLDRDQPLTAAVPEILRVEVHTVKPTRLEETLANLRAYESALDAY